MIREIYNSAGIYLFMVSGRDIHRVEGQAAGQIGERKGACNHQAPGHISMAESEYSAEHSFKPPTYHHRS